MTVAAEALGLVVRLGVHREAKLDDTKAPDPLKWGLAHSGVRAHSCCTLL